MRHFLPFSMLVVLLFTFAACSDDTGGITGGTGGTGTVMDDNPTVTNPDYVAFFDPAKIHDITITISQQEWSAMSNDLYKSQYPDGLGRNDKDAGQKYLFNAEIYRKANYTQGGTTFNDVGIRVRGNTSRYFPQFGNNFYWTHFRVSFSQDFAENEDVYGSPAINTVTKTDKRRHGVRGLIFKYHVDDTSGVKEPLSYDLLRRFGLPVPGFTFAKLTIRVGTTDRYFGLYQVYEPIDKEFIRLRWNTSAYLFKCLWSISGPAYLSTQDYLKNVDIGIEKRDPATTAEASTWINNPYDDLGYNPSTTNVRSPYRPTYDLKARETEIATARTELDAFIQGISSKSGATFNSWITTVFDVDRFLRFQALTSLVAQWDDYWDHFNNFYLLKRPSDSRWVLIPYDYDHTFESDKQTKSLVNWGQSSAQLAAKILANTVWMNKYKDYIRILISPTNSYFTAAAIGARIDALQATIGTPGAPVHNDPDAYSPAAGKTTLLDFVNARVTFAEGEVGGGGGFASNYSQIYLRGDFNSWGTTAMSLIADNTWRVTVSMDNGALFKFDDVEDWGPDDWGEDNQTGGSTSGICEHGGGNITNNQLTGQAVVTFNDDTLAWSITGP